MGPYQVSKRRIIFLIWMCIATNFYFRCVQSYCLSSEQTIFLEDTFLNSYYNCPWNTFIDEMPNRIPQKLPRVICRTDGSDEWPCVPVYALVPVLVRNLQNHSIWTERTERIAVACAARWRG